MRQKEPKRKLLNLSFSHDSLGKINISLPFFLHFRYLVLELKFYVSLEGVWDGLKAFASSSCIFAESSHFHRGIFII